MNQNKRRETLTSVYHGTLFKMLGFLLMETLMLSLQPTNSYPCNHFLGKPGNSEVKCKADEIAPLVLKVVENSSESNDLGGPELLNLTKVMLRFIVCRETNTTLSPPNITESVPDMESDLELAINATSNLLSTAHNKAWMRLSRHNQSIAATRLLVGMEKLSAILAQVTNRPGSIIKTEPEIKGVEINIINITEAGSNESLITFNANGLQVTLSLEDVKRRASNKRLRRATFIQYRKIGKWLKSIVKAKNKSDVRQTIITKVFSASIFPREEHSTKLNGSIRFTLRHEEYSITELQQHRDTLDSSNVSCVFWNFSTDDCAGHWSDEGCEVVSSNDHNTTCECDHLTHFAVLMSSVDKEISTKHEFALQIITYIGCTISIVCLALALFTFCFFRNLQCDRNTIHKNLAFSLLIAQLIFVFGINQYRNETLCDVVAGFLHYFFLASFAWMCLEGVQLYILLIEVFEIEKSRVKWYYLGGYGTPALIVLTSVSVMAYSPIGASGAYGSNGTEKHCWLNTEAGFIWAFNGPVIAVFAVNLVMLGLAIYIMCKHSSSASWKLKNKSKIQEIGSWLRGAAIIMVLLGTTWIFGIFLNFDNQTVVFEYIFVILNSFQGLFIFVFHCLTNDKVQKEYQRAIQRSTYLPECIRAKYGDVNKSGVLSTPNQSRSSEKTAILLTSFPQKCCCQINISQKDEICQRRINTASGSPRLADFVGVGTLDESDDNLESTEDSNRVPESAINDNKFNV